MSSGVVAPVRTQEKALILEQNLHFLRQGLELLGTLDAEVYATGRDGRSPVGAHLRHCVDYYRCFLSGIESGRVDYDARERDPALETDPDVAAKALGEIAGRLSTLEPRDFSRVLEVKVDTPADAAHAWSRSSLARELQFLVSHTVHHYALIGLLLRLHGVEPADELGVAPSTLAYRRAVGAGAR